MPTERLASAIAELCPQDGSYGTAIEDLYLTRASTKEVPRSSLSRAVFCVVAQGAKSALIGDKRFLYHPGRYLLASLDLPCVGQIEEASRTKPFLGVSICLDFDELTALAQEIAPPRPRSSSAYSGLTLGCLDGDLLDAVIRYTELLRKPKQITMMAPLIRKEIFYRLLLSEGSGLLQQMLVGNGKGQRLAAGLSWMRKNATRSIRMEELAREVRMSPSSMHSWFRSTTSMSPLQFQKQLRLQEARRMMLTESTDAATASRRVGYQSPSQFSREYRRFFGAPPLRNIARLRQNVES